MGLSVQANKLKTTVSIVSQTLNDPEMKHPQIVRYEI